MGQRELPCSEVVERLPHDHDASRLEHLPVSAHDLFGAILRAAGDRDPSLISCVDEPERSVPVMQSYWYNNRGRTLERFRYNQCAFVAGDQRFLYRRKRWYVAPLRRPDEAEADFVLLDSQVNPL